MINSAVQEIDFYSIFISTQLLKLLLISLLTDI